MHTVTDALDQTTAFNTYNAHGQPLTITDPNGIVMTLAYDARQRLISRQIGNETTVFGYWPTGLLKRVTLPDSSSLLYTYDGAHRLTKIEDGEGNRIEQAGVPTTPPLIRFIRSPTGSPRSSSYSCN